ncbi:hypothetical protein ABTF76_22065, partial [Acinetobacter baumannii]
MCGAVVPWCVSCLGGLLPFRPLPGLKQGMHHNQKIKNPKIQTLSTTTDSGGNRKTNDCPCPCDGTWS